MFEEEWLTPPTEEALKLQRPLPDEGLRVVAVGERKDDPVTALKTQVTIL